jgi:hypothetical protein
MFTSFVIWSPITRPFGPKRRTTSRTCSTQAAMSPSWAALGW